MSLFFYLGGLQGLSLVAASRGYPPVAVHGLVIVVSPLVAEHRLKLCRLR